MKALLFAILLFSNFSSLNSTYACSTLAVKSGDGMFMAKSYDWTQGHGLLIVNKRNVSKRSMSLPKLKSVEWVSKYGSVTFNQQARELPSGGINEKGLAIELMWLENGKYPILNPDTTAINELQWIQFQLDKHSTVKEVLACAKKLPIAKVVAPLHYLICDPNECGIVDFEEGKVITYEGKTLEVKALTNHPYEESLRKYRELIVTGKTLPVGVDSLGRFFRVAKHAENFANNEDPIVYAFKALKDVDVSPKGADRNDTKDMDLGYSQWNIVYDTKKRIVHFKTYSIPSIRRIDIDSLDFDCQKPVMILDLNAKLEGTVNRKLNPYKVSDNAKIVKESYKFLRTQVPEKILASMEKGSTYYPESTKCVSTSQ